MRTVLIGAGGTATAFAACVALRRYWPDSIRLYTMDINPAHLVTSSLLCDEFLQVPPFRDPAFDQRVKTICKQRAVDFYLPLFPEEILAAARLSAADAIGSTTVLCPSVEVSKICADKASTARWLTDHGFPSPRTSIGAPDFDVDKYVIKPRLGTGSVGMRILTRPELDEYLRSDADEEASECVIQEMCRKPEITIDVFRSSAAGIERALCRERVEVKNGVATKVRIFEDPELQSLGLKLAAELDYEGVFCFQVARSDDQWKIFDINARPGAATATSALTGNDFFAAMWANAFGDSVASYFRELTAPAFVTRQYADYLMVS